MLEFTPGAVTAAGSAARRPAADPGPPASSGRWWRCRRPRWPTAPPAQQRSWSPAGHSTVCMLLVHHRRHANRCWCTGQQEPCTRPGSLSCWRPQCCHYWRTSSASDLSHLSGTVAAQRRLFGLGCGVSADHWRHQAQLRDGGHGRRRAPTLQQGPGPGPALLLQTQLQLRSSRLQPATISGRMQVASAHTAQPPHDAAVSLSIPPRNRHGARHRRV